MASLITLTSSDPGNPPVVLSPSHVVSVVPRKKMSPDMASQHAHVKTSFAGAKVKVVTGDYYNVEENHDVVCTLVDRALAPAVPNGLSIPQSAIKGLDLRDEGQEQQFIDQLKETGVPVSAPQKAAAKKVAPPPGDKAEEKDED